MTPFHAKYFLRCCLDTETAGSMLDCRRFQNPFDDKLKIHDCTSGDARRQNVDLLESFNFLLVLKMRTTQFHRLATTATEGALVIEGENPASETVLVIWRNGDTAQADPLKKILLTEQVVHDLMFDMEDD